MAGVWAGEADVDVLDGRDLRYVLHAALALDVDDDRHPLGLPVGVVVAALVARGADVRREPSAFSRTRTTGAAPPRSAAAHTPTVVSAVSGPCPWSMTTRSSPVNPAISATIGESKTSNVPMAVSPAPPAHAYAATPGTDGRA